MPDAQFALPHHATPIPMYPPLRTPQGKQPRHHAAPCRVHRLVGSNDLPAAPRRPDLYHHHCMPGVWFRDVSLVGLRLRAASSLRCQPFLALPLPLRHPLHLPKTMRGWMVGDSCWALAEQLVRAGLFGRSSYPITFQIFFGWVVIEAPERAYIIIADQRFGICTIE